MIVNREKMYIYEKNSSNPLLNNGKTEPSSEIKWKWMLHTKSPDGCNLVERVAVDRDQRKRNNSRLIRTIANNEDEWKKTQNESRELTTKMLR